jgi:hypothetical protein
MTSRAIRCRLVCVLAAVLLAFTAGASAQEMPLEDQPIGRFVVDVRAAFPKFKQDPNIATGIGVSALNLPTRALGLVFGAHWYPVHVGPMAIGVGGEMIMAGRKRTLAPTTADGVAGPTVHSHMSSVTPQISFNFGKRQGWSYISGGIGGTDFTAERVDAPLPAQESRTKTFNYGGGARWFSKKHVAVSMDLRFYAINAQLQTSVRPAFSRMTLVVFSVGAAFK